MLKLICCTADIRNLKHDKDVVSHGTGYGSKDGNGHGDGYEFRYGNVNGDGFGEGTGFGEGGGKGYGNRKGNGRGDPFACAANYRSDLEILLEQICEVDLS